MFLLNGLAALQLELRAGHEAAAKAADALNKILSSLAQHKISISADS
jgi:hypothetical protein